MIAINQIDGGPPPEEPPQEEIDEWCREMTRVIKHGGCWGIPRSGLVFEFDHDNKTMTLISGNPTHPDFYATQTAFARVGWSVRRRPKPEEPKEKRDAPN